MHDLDELVKQHKKLYEYLDSSSKREFISDWNCIHPFYQDLFSVGDEKIGVQHYNYVRADDDLSTLIAAFHKQNDLATYALNQILVSNGSATVISALFIWLKATGVEYIYYVPPLYYTFHFFSKLFGIALRPVTKDQLLNNDIILNLPDKKCILVITDPIWYAGCEVKNRPLMQLTEWQHKTGSKIFIDGSFQYFKWNKKKKESTSEFDPQNTFRLICPTKAIGMHGFRFAYLLLPQEYYPVFDFILDNMSGSSNAYDILFAKKCMQVLCSEKSNNELINYTSDIFEQLMEKNIISTSIIPECGYFIFAELLSPDKSRFATMDGRYFEQPDFENYVRINLLGNSIQDLLKNT